MGGARRFEHRNRELLWFSSEQTRDDLELDSRLRSTAAVNHAEEELSRAIRIEQDSDNLLNLDHAARIRLDSAWIASASEIEILERACELLESDDADRAQLLLRLVGRLAAIVGRTAVAGPPMTTGDANPLRSAKLPSAHRYSDCRHRCGRRLRPSRQARTSPQQHQDSARRLCCSRPHLALSDRHRKIPHSRLRRRYSGAVQ